MEQPAREVRKTVTILFCDLVHSTGLAEGVDPEAYRRVQSRFFEEMRGVIEQHGGAVEKFIGDEVMAVFGVPAVHEDDALRAVRSAAQMRQRIEVLNEELERTSGVRLQVRIGVNTGEVIALDHARGEGYVSGEAVIVAKRLEQAAAPGEILIGKATYPLVSHAITAGPLERIPVKGKREDVGRRRVHEVDREAPGVARRLDAPIVGREQELELLRGAFERAVEERSCRLCTVLGVAGIGKSRLLAELLASLGDSATTAVGRCLPYGEGITFWPLRELLQSLGGDALGAALAKDEQGDLVLELLQGATGASTRAGLSEETFWAARRAFEALARERPLVVCFEDVHWAEPTLLDLIEYVVGWCRDAPLFVVCLARPDLVESRPTWLSPQPHQDAFVVEPLSGAETEALLDHLGPDGVLGREIRGAIAEAAEGNPLFLEQMAAVAAERGEEADLPIPPSIQALLAERLDRLGRDERAVIERASVVGRDFSLAAVAALSPDETRTSLAANLLALVRTGLVRPDPRPTPDEDRFRFHHVLIRDTAYETVPKQHRAELHERLVEWVESSQPAWNLDELVGYHLEQAHELRSQLGGDEHAQGLAERAAARLRSGGLRALERGDIPAASRLLGRAARLRPDDLETRRELGFVLVETGELARAAELFDDVAETARARGDTDEEAHAELGRLLVKLRVDAEARTPADTALAAAQRTIPIFEQAGDELGLARAWRTVSSAHWMACQWGARAEALEAALVHAQRAESRREQADLLAMLGLSLYWGPMPVPEAIGRCESILSESRDRILQSRIEAVLAGLKAMLGEFDEARRLYDRSKEVLEELGLQMMTAAHTIVRGATELLAGDPAAAERELRLGVERFRELGERAGLTTLAGVLAEALYAQGRYGEAAEAVELSRDSASPEDIASQVIWRSVDAKLLGRSGRAEEAERAATEAVTLAAGTDALNLRGDALTAAAEARRLLGRPDADAVLREALPLYEAKGNVVAAERTRALLAAPERTPTP